MTLRERLFAIGSMPRDGGLERSAPCVPQWRSAKQAGHVENADHLVQAVLELLLPGCAQDRGVRHDTRRSACRG